MARPSNEFIPPLTSFQQLTAGERIHKIPESNEIAINNKSRCDRPGGANNNQTYTHTHVEEGGDGFLSYHRLIYN